VKTLYILRHAKSSWDKPDLADFDRPLNERGLIAAPFMGEIIYDRQFQPDVILVSPAKRGKQTAILVKETAELKARIKYDDRIYEASPQILLQVVAEVDNKHESVMLVGHNPGIEGFIRYLTGKTVQMPTAAFAVIELNVKGWRDTDADDGNLKTVIRPKDEMMKSVEAGE
jgi:phosphohistidine phosphatase